MLGGLNGNSEGKTSLPWYKPPDWQNVLCLPHLPLLVTFVDRVLGPPDHIVPLQEVRGQRLSHYVRHWVLMKQGSYWWLSDSIYLLQPYVVLFESGHSTAVPFAHPAALLSWFDYLKPRPRWASSCFLTQFGLIKSLRRREPTHNQIELSRTSKNFNLLKR